MFIHSFIHEGELIGMDYLKHQNNQVLLPILPDEEEGDDDGEDIGCLDEEELEDPTQPPPRPPARPASSSQSLEMSTTQRATPHRGKHIRSICNSDFLLLFFCVCFFFKSNISVWIVFAVFNWF